MLSFITEIFIYIFTYSDSNFGEIEMCLNEELIFNIKIRSRVCDLFSLSKTVKKELSSY